MKIPDHPDNEDAELQHLLHQIRAAPATADSDPARVAVGFETRVLARLREKQAAPDVLRWFWRWSAVFGCAAAICVVLVIQDYQALNDDPLAALEGSGTLLGWLF